MRNGSRYAPDVVRVAGDRREREHVVGEEVALAQLDRVDAELERGLVDETFEQRRRLRPAGAAVGAHRGRVRDRHGDVELDRREVVRAVRHAAGAARQERADRRIGAGVADEPHPQPGERAVAAAPELGVLHLAAAVGERLHVLAARRHPHDRPSERPRRGGDDRVLGVEPGLAAEAAADLRRDDVHIGGVEAERRGELGVQPVRHLGRRPHA